MNTIATKGLLTALASGALIGSYLLIHPVTTTAQTVPLLPAATLRVGVRSASVTTLQQFLATEPLLYPQGIVSGYFGPLTKNAVEQFQLQYGLGVDGIAGPNTIAMINNIIASGKGIDIRVPVFNSFSISSVSHDRFDVDLSTNEPVKAYVYYDTKPITGGDSELPFTLPFVSGTVQKDESLSQSKHMTVSGLSAHTTYYIVVLLQDSQGNVSARYSDPITTA